MIPVLACVAALLALAVAPASAATVSCGETLTADTIVDNDIECSAPDAIGVIIGADNITVRFRDHKILGAGAIGQGSIGITDDGIEHTGVEIRNAQIDGFDTGVYLNAADTSVKAMTFSAVDTGMVLTGNGNYVYRNEMASPGTIGLDIAGDDLYLWGNRITGLPDSGILVSGDNPLVVRNTVTGCASFDGITVADYTTYAKVAQNTVSGCDAGIVMAGSGTNQAHLQSSDVFDNCDGLFVSDPTLFLWRNNAHDNACSGMTVGVPGVLVRENTATNNDIGIDAVDGTLDGGGNKAGGNLSGDCFVVVCVPTI